MSGLEPVAALSLACNILQIVDVGRQTIQLAKTVYEDGSLDKTLENHVVSLEKISNDIMNFRVPLRWSELQKVVDKCSDAAGELQGEINYLLRNSKPGSLLSTIKIAVKANLHKGRLENLKRKLDDAEDMMQTGLLASLWHHANVSQLDINTLNSDLRLFVDQYKKDHDSTEKLIREEGQSTRGQISAASADIQSEIRLHADVQASGAQHERLLSSLKYPELNKRRNDIRNAFGETFQWIFTRQLPPGRRRRFDPPHQSNWNSFGDWLQSTDSMYWISGKPGSGKSTLMKYILTAPQTVDHLQIWRSNVVVISHFFWRPGSPAQRSLKGLLSSLAYQLLSQHSNPSVLDNILLSFPGAGFKDTVSDWSIQELDAVCCRFVAAFDQPICLLLDGLDEYMDSENEIDQIFDLLDRLLRTGKDIKICVSSRPEPLLQDHLKVYPQLWLQDLTWSDLQSYAETHIKGPSSTTLGHSLVRKSGGVFLWLCLAIKSINKGHLLGDSPKLIQARIDSLPESLSKLYQDMWKKASDENPKEYRQIAALYFKLVLGCKRQSPMESIEAMDTFDIMLASTSFADQLLRVDTDEELPSTVPADVLLGQCQETKRKLAVYCAGLLKLVDCSNQPKLILDLKDRRGMHYMMKLHSFASYRKTWQFIHRTAHDFLLDSAEGQEILGYDSTSLFHISSRITKSWLARCRIFEMETWHPVEKDEGALENRVSLAEAYVLELQRTMEESKDWIQEDFDELLFSCERLCDVGALLSWQSGGTSPPRTELCVSGPFFRILADGWNADKHRHIDQTMISKILLKACRWNSHDEFVGTLLREGADPNCKVPYPVIPGLAMGLDSPFTESLKRMLLWLSPGRYLSAGTEGMSLRHASITKMLKTTADCISHGANLGASLGLVFEIADYPGRGTMFELSPLSRLDLLTSETWRWGGTASSFGIAVLPAYAALEIILQTSHCRLQQESPNDEDEDSDLLRKLGEGVSANEEDEHAHSLLLFNTIPNAFSLPHLKEPSWEYSEVPTPSSAKHLIRQLLVNCREMKGAEVTAHRESWFKETVKGEGNLLRRLRNLGLLV